MHPGRQLVAASLLLSALPTAVAAASVTNVLIVYGADAHNHTGILAGAIADGAASVPGAAVRATEVLAANYKRDVFEWADAIILGSSVFNGNADPRMLEFINSFDFMDDLR